MGLSFKAIAVGCVLSVAVSNRALRSTFINASWMALNISVPIALFVFFLFAGILNVLLGLVHGRLALAARARRMRPEPCPAAWGRPPVPPRQTYRAPRAGRVRRESGRAVRLPAVRQADGLFSDPYGKMFI